MGPEFRECRGKFTIHDAISPLKRRINHKRTSQSGKDVVGQEPYLSNPKFPARDTNFTEMCHTFRSVQLICRVSERVTRN